MKNDHERKWTRDASDKENHILLAEFRAYPVRDSACRISHFRSNFKHKTQFSREFNRMAAEYADLQAEFIQPFAGWGRGPWDGGVSGAFFFTRALFYTSWSTRGVLLAWPLSVRAYPFIVHYRGVSTHSPPRTCSWNSGKSYCKFWLEDVSLTAGSWGITWVPVYGLLYEIYHAKLSILNKKASGTMIGGCFLKDISSGETTLCFGCLRAVQTCFRCWDACTQVYQYRANCKLTSLKFGNAFCFFFLFFYFFTFLKKK